MSSDIKNLGDPKAESIADSKRISKISLIGFAVFVSPILLASAILYVNMSLLAPQVAILLGNWPVWVVAGPVFLGIPFWLRRSAQKVLHYKREVDTRKLNHAYKSILVWFGIFMVAYIFTGPIVFLLLDGFTQTDIKMTLLSAFFYLVTIIAPSVLVLNGQLEKLFQGSATSISFSIKAKLGATAFLSVIGGIGVVIVSIYSLLVRYTEFPELGLTLSDLLTRIVTIGVMVGVIQILPNMLLLSRFSGLLRSLQKFIHRLSTRDLTKDQLQIISMDEFGIIAGRLNELQQNFRAVVEKLESSSGRLTNSSENISNVSRQTSDTSAELASNSEEIAASIEEVTSSINLASENAMRSADINQKSTASMEEGQQLVEQSLSDIMLINNKVDLIETIAQETHLLAINAFIEASKYGKDGSGFSIIAQEVRALANKSQDAANEIMELTERCVSATNHSKTKIDDAVGIAKETSELSSEIASASKEQLVNIEHINQSIQELNSYAQYMAANSEKLSKTSEQIKDHSDDLSDQIGAFKLNASKA